MGPFARVLWAGTQQRCSHPQGIAPPRDDGEYCPISNQVSGFEQPKIRGNFLILTGNTTCLRSMHSLTLKSHKIGVKLKRFNEK